MGFESLYKLSVIMNVIDNMSSPMKKIGNSTQQSISGMDKMSGMFGNMTQAGVVIAGAGVQIAEGLQKPVQATFETKRAISELASLGVEQLDMMENAAKSFSNTWAGTSKSDFITAAYDIKSGISSLSDEGVARYTEMAGITATATKSTIATMTDLFATGYGIYKDFYSDMSDEEFGEMFSGGIASSVKIFKTNGNEMAAAISTLGASATNAQVPLEEQLSILGMLQATMSGSEAGTKYNAFLRSAVKGGKELGLSFVDANNKMLSLPEILDKLHEKFGDTIDAAEKIQLQEAFGDSESVKMIDLLYNKTGDLQNNIMDLYHTMGSGAGAAMEMAETINQSDPSVIERLQQRMHNVGETLGNAVTPKVMEYGAKIEGILDRADAWISNHQELASNIFQVLAVLSVLLITVGVAGSTIGLLGSSVIKIVRVFQMGIGAAKGFKAALDIGIPVIKAMGSRLLSMGKTAITSVISAMGPMISSVWSFTSALLANPITWIIIGIVALVAGIVLLYNKCEAFRNLVNKLGAVLKSVFGAAVDTVKEKLNNMKEAYEKNGGGLKGIAAAAIEGVKGYYSAGFAFLDKLTGGKLTEIKNKFSEKLAPVKEIIGNVLSAVSGTVKEKLDNIKNAYVQNGGGIKGIAAAYIEAVKGYYTDGYTFIDKLTGGKLTEIKNKFVDGINNVKNVIMNSITWFKNSGSRIMDTFASGIKSAINKPVEAVKGGLQKIRNMLPFSDAKTGPLSKLTLSGNKVLSTLSTGIKQSENLPAEAVNQSFEKIDLSVKKRPGKTGLKQDEERAGINEGTEKPEGKKTVIERLMLNVDLKTIKDLQALLKLMDEIEDYTNSRGEDELQPA